MATGPAALLAHSLASETHVEGLAIEAVTPAQAGQRSYGVRVIGGAGQLVSRYNTITAAAGAPGLAGFDGIAEAAGANGGTGGPFMR